MAKRIAQHGTDSKYVSGCRCESCKEAHVTYHRNWRQDKQEILASNKRQLRVDNRERYNKYQLDYYHKNKEKIKPSERNRRLKREYGITQETYLEMVKNQDGKCSICDERPGSQKNFHVDHDHITGVVRALLCNKCNAHLGWYENCKDGVDAYLEHHKKEQL